jgi:L-arabinonolactonase
MGPPFALPASPEKMVDAVHLDEFTGAGDWRKMIEVSCLYEARAVLGEGPFWDVGGQRLYWVDIKGRLIHQFDPSTGIDKHWSTPEIIGSLAVRAKGGLVVALRSGFYFYDLELGQATVAAIPAHHPEQNRFNDGKTDRQGRFWSGSMDDNEKEPTGGLFRLDSKLRCEQLVDGIVVSNSLCWSPDGRTMYFADSPRRTVWAWDFEPETGTIGNRRPLIQFSAKHGVPDGATVDAEGCIWLAHWDGWRVTRYDPKGRVRQEIKFPVQRPTCPMFGGPNLNLVYVTSASINLSERELTEQPHAGGLFVFEAEVPGLPEMPFQG